MGRFLIWLSGAQPDILAQCKHDRAKYIGIGSAILLTSSVAAVSMTFALHIALAAEVPAAIPFAVAWGLAIMSLDRWLIVSLVRQPPLRYLMLALPRLMLGLLFGIIISTPLTLQIFHVEIDNQIAIDHTNALNAYNNSPAVQALTAKINADWKAVKADQNVINTGGATANTAPGNDATLVSLEQQRTADQNQANGYYTAWHCEMYGGSTCVGHYVIGSGPAEKRDWNQYTAYTARVQSDNTQIANAQAQLTAQNKQNATTAASTARTNLTADVAKLNTDQGNLGAMKSAYIGTLGKDNGILAHLKALDELRGSSSTLMMADLLLFMFFTVIEWLPVLVKVLLNLGPENTYEKLLAKAEKASLRNADNETARQYLASVREMDVTTEGGSRFNEEWETTVLPGLIRDAIDARERVARAKLKRWEQQAMANTSSNSYEDIFTPGGTFRAMRAPVPDWLNARRREPRRRMNVRPRLAAAWHAFRSGGAQQRLRAATGPMPRLSEPFLRAPAGGGAGPVSPPASARSRVSQAAAGCRRPR
jgi:Domain of unknown function (DUF4407)